MPLAGGSAPLKVVEEAGLTHLPLQPGDIGLGAGDLPFDLI